VEEGEERLSTVKRAEEVVWAREVASEDATAGVGECGAVSESVTGGEAFASPVTGAEWAEGGVTGRGAETVGVIGMEAVAGDGLKSGGLQVAGFSVEAAMGKRVEGGRRLLEEGFVEGVMWFLGEVVVPFLEHARVG